MNGRTSKKIRKVVNQKIKADMESMVRVLSKEKLYWRIVMAIRIIFRWHPEEIKFEVKR